MIRWLRTEGSEAPPAERGAAMKVAQLKGQEVQRFWASFLPRSLEV